MPARKDRTRALLCPGATFFAWDEMRDIIRGAHGAMAAHGAIAARHAREGGGAVVPVMGHDVLVSNLWEVRNFWEWLAPGITQPGGRDAALSRAAYVHYDNLRFYRDFLIKPLAPEEPAVPEAPAAPVAPEKPTAASACPGPQAVGLWAKQFMTSDQYDFKGTLMTRLAVQELVGDRQPGVAKTTAAEEKLEREVVVRTPAGCSHSQRSQSLDLALLGPSIVFAADVA